MSENRIQDQKQIPMSFCGKRLDATLGQLFPDYSRAQLTKWLEKGEIKINGESVKPKYKVKGFELVTLNCVLSIETQIVPQDIDLDIVYEDDDLLVINKASNWVVHPGAGNPDNTVVNALLFHYPALNHLPRAGIIHRLDKDTTGLLITAKHLKSFHSLVRMMQERLISRHYLAITYGELLEPLRIDAPIGRHPNHRTKMSITGNGKPAVTHVEPIENYPGLTFVQVKLETGRTHQIRVHLTQKGYPLVGDQTYQQKNIQNQSLNKYSTPLPEFERQALHAFQLSFEQPIAKQKIELTAPLPDDMEHLLDWLDKQYFENDDEACFDDNYEDS